MCWDLLIPWLSPGELQRLVFHLQKQTITLRGCAFSPGGQRPSTEQDPIQALAQEVKLVQSLPLLFQASLRPLFKDEKLKEERRWGWVGNPR